MLLTKTNVLLDKTPVVTVGASSDDVENIVNPDFSANYTGVSKSNLTIDFGSTGEINYVAVAGIILKGNGSGLSSVTLFDGATQIATALIKRDHCVLLSFELQTFTNLKIVLLNNTANLEPTISFAAAGLTLTVPNSGEQSGYNRNWLGRSTRTKVTTNNLSAPVAITRKPISLRGALNMPNVTVEFSQNDFQDFLDFAETDLFFVNEDPLIPESTYCCYEISGAAVKAHSETRALNNLSFKFKVFTGI